jgi:hypothetical protein
MKLRFANRDSGADRCAFDPDQLNATVGAACSRPRARATRPYRASCNTAQERGRSASTYETRGTITGSRL